MALWQCLKRLLIAYMIITPGTNATISDPTIEAQLLKSLLLLEFWEKNTEFNPNTRDFVQATFNTEALSWDITFSLPCRQAINDMGSPTLLGENYLTNTPFTPGDPSGTFKSLSLPAYCIELIMTGQIWENNSQYNPNSRNNIAATFNSDRNLLVGTVTIFCEFNIQPQISQIAKEYLNVELRP